MAWQLIASMHMKPIEGPVGLEDFAFDESRREQSIAVLALGERDATKYKVCNDLILKQEEALNYARKYLRRRELEILVELGNFKKPSR